MPKREIEFYSVAEAKAKLSQLVNLTKNKDVVITKNGHPAAVLMDYERFKKISKFIDDLYELYLLEIGDPSCFGKVSQDQMLEEDIEEV
ncbi:type II toxin-antitoxin system Phd/YefM family antitoxin [Pseudothermotoga thermarum]|uniref:Antitoxin n=1 Tax=Pseudothermotoga thermarum DSM 5069 TaxID=688269 RepID=F7YYN3_9THEM|nr:type II toxin-antitoxin system Phd/YefM family antitoxin [Pseudothermotoga thermarum]AEH51065.1 prevent-host-death family protein [Pseudothermotoga thermarum DSM 5069]